MPQPKIINYHNLKPADLNLLFGEGQWVYIGRVNRWRGIKGSILANPFPIQDDTPQERKRVVERYRQYITAHLDSGDKKYISAFVEASKAHALVCWCSPKICHGDVLVELFDQYRATHPEWFK